jgi:hypothetical protein
LHTFLIDDIALSPKTIECSDEGFVPTDRELKALDNTHMVRFPRGPISTCSQSGCGGLESRVVSDIQPPVGG